MGRQLIRLSDFPTKQAWKEWAHPSEYPDTNGDGVPDAFENRRPITEILNDDLVPDTGTVQVEIETVIRSANVGEWFLGHGGLEQCPRYDANRYRGYVIRRFIK